MTATPTPAAPSLPYGEDSGASDSDGVINTSGPVLIGQTLPNAIVTLYDNGNATGTATADTNGYYTIYPDPVLDDGKHSLTITASAPGDTASAQSSPIFVVVDTSVPDPPTAPLLAPTFDTGASAEDGITSTSSLKLTGTAEPGSTVQLYVNGQSTALVRTTAAADGTYTLATNALADGAYTLTVTATDLAGNVSKASAATAVTIDTLAPTAPATPTLAPGSDTGASHSDGLTGDTTPVIVGTTEANATVAVFDAGVLVGKATADGQGNYAITASALAEGAHTLTVKATDAAGNVSAASAPLAVVVDTATPTASSTPNADQAIFGSVPFEVHFSEPVTGLTLSALRVVGTGTAAGEVTQITGSGSDYTVLVDGLSGVGSLGLALAPGNQVTDAAGNAAQLTVSNDYTYDNQDRPNSVLVGTYSAGGTSGHIGLSGGGRLVSFDTNVAETTNDSNPNPDVYVEDLRTGGITLISAGVDGSVHNGVSGFSSLSANGSVIAFVSTATGLVPDGPTDGLPNVYVAHLSTSNVAAGQAVGITDIQLVSAGNDQDGIDTPSASDTFDSVGNYGAPMVSADGTHVVFASDKALIAGVTPGISNIYELDIATGDLTLVSAGLDNTGGNAGSDQATVSGDGTMITYESSASNLGGAVAPAEAHGENVYLYNVTTNTTTLLNAAGLLNLYGSGEDVESFGAQINSLGTWVTYTVQVGNSTAMIVNQNVAGADANAGKLEQLTPYTLFSFDDYPTVSTGGRYVAYQLNDQGLNTATPPDQVGLTDALTNTTIDIGPGSGPLLAPDGNAIAYDNENVTVSDGVATDLGGQILVTTLGPTVGIDPVSGDSELNAAEWQQALTSGLVVTGVTDAASGASLRLQLLSTSTGAVLSTGQATLTSDGTWSVTLAAADLATLPDGTYKLTAIASADDGASFPSNRLIIVDTQAPATPDAPKLDAGSDSSLANNGLATDLSTPTVTGTTEAGATVTLYDSSATTLPLAVGTAIADGNGVYTITAAKLADGRHMLDVTATDDAGNVSAVSADVTITVDTIAPTQPSARLEAASDTGTSDSDGITSNATPNILGTGEAGTTVTLYDTDKVAVLGTAAVDKDGNYTIAASQLSEGTHLLTVTDSDVAGNVSPRSDAVSVTVDTLPPFTPTITSVTGPLVGGKLAPLVTVSGVAEAGAKVTLSLDGGSYVLGETTAAADGDYAIESDPLPAGDGQTLAVIATDAAGNASQPSLPVDVNITDSATPPPGSPPDTPTLLVQLTDGPIAGATVYADSNGNGTRDANEGSGVTDAGGQASLADTGGTLIATGGVDASTGLALDGALYAPAHATVISPLTTLLHYYTTFAAGDLAAQQSALATLLGLQASGSTVLTALDPTAAALGGSAALDPSVADGAALIESAKIIDTATEFASFLSGLVNVNIDTVIAAMAKIAAQSGALDLDSQVTLNDILSSTVTLSAPIPTDVANTVVAVAAATNANLDQFDSHGGASLVTSVAQVEAVAQGQAAPQLKQLAVDSNLIPSITAQYTGTTLYDATSASVALIDGTPELAPGFDTGRSNNDNVIDLTAPTFIGKANPGTFVTLFQYVTATNLTTSTVVIGTAIADASGNYTVANAALASGGTVYISGPVGAVGSTTDPGVSVGALISVPAATPTLSITPDEAAASGPFILDATVAAAAGDDAGHSALLVHLDPAADAFDNSISGTIAIFADGGTAPIGTGAADLAGASDPINITTTALTLGQHILTVVETAAGGTVITGTQSYTVTVGPASVADGVAAAVGTIAGATVHTTPPPVSEAFNFGDYDAVTSTTDSAGNYVATLPTTPEYSVASANGYDTATGLRIGGYVAQFGGKNSEAATALGHVIVGAVEPTLYAPYGFTAVSPLTTVLYEMDANDQILGGPTPADNDGNEARVLAAFGLPSTLDLATLNPIAQAQAGDTAPLLIEAKLLDTVTMLSPFFTFDFNAIAAYIGNFGTLDLDSASTIDAMLSDYYTGDTLTSDQLASLSAAIAASNSAIDTQAAASTSLAATLSSTFAAETVAQGAETADLQYAAFFGDDEDTRTIADVASSYAGAALVTRIQAAQAQETQATSFVADGPATTGASSVVFTIAFAKPVTNVSAATFSVIASSGLIGAHVTGVTPVAGSGGTIYDITVSTGVGNGTLALSFSGDTLKSVTGGPITNGLFAPAVTTINPGIPEPAEGVAVGDFNGDGKPDVVLTGDATYGATVYMNNGDGTFTAEAPIAGAPYGFDIDVGDVNGDGKLDIIETGTGNSATGDVLSVLLGHGDGTFDKPIDTTVSSTTLAVGDFNGDGRDDVAISTSTGIDILLGNGDGSFTAGQAITATGGYQAMQTADLNGDGKLDLVTTNYNTSAVSIFLGDGHGGFTAAATPSITLPDPPDGIAIGDLNGDGIPDIVVTGIELAAGQQSAVEVLLGKGDGTFTPLAPFVYSAAGDTTFLQNFHAGSVVIGDLNNDGKPDLALGSGGGTLVLDGNGDGTFSLGDATSEGTSNFGDQQDIALADVNGDGRTDIVEPGEDQTYGEAQSAAGLDVLMNEAPPVLGSSTAPVTIARDAVADPVLAIASGAGTLTHNGNAYTLNLGSLAPGQAASVMLALANAAAAPADSFDGLFSTPDGSGFTVTGDTLPDAVAAGASYAGLDFTADTSTPGSHSETITFAPRDTTPVAAPTTAVDDNDVPVVTPAAANPDAVARELPVLTLTVTDDVGPAQPMASLGAPSSVVLPNVRLGEADSQAIALTNTAASGSPDLDLTATATGDATVTGTVTGLAPGSGDSTDVIVGLGTETAGAVSGSVILAPVSDTGTGVALATAAVAVSGNVFRTATADVAPVNVVLHVGDPGLVPITLKNTAPSDGYSENLAASLSASTGGLGTTAADATGTLVGAGASDSSLGLTVATTAAGTVTGTATLDFASTGTGADGTSLDGLAPQALADQTVPISVTVDNYAQAALAETLDGVTQTGTTVDLGSVAMGSAPVTLNLAALNTAVGPADLLGGSFTATGDSAFSTALSDVQGIGAGQSQAAGTVTLATGTAGHFTETIRFAATGSNASGYSGALPAQSLTVTGTVLAATDAYTIAGEPTVQTTTDAVALHPFAAMALSNSNPAAFGTATVALSSTANGLLSNLGAGTLSPDGATYTVSGTTAAIQAALRGLLFTPTDHQVAAGQSVSTTADLTVADSASAASAETALVATAAEDPPVITGTEAGQTITDQQTLHPFAGVTLTDPDAGASETTTITLTAQGTLGTLSGSGLTQTAVGTYVLTAASPADEQAALRALVFTPTAGTESDASTVTTKAALSVSDGRDTTTNTATSIVTTQTSTGTATGDVHMVTLDGLRYDFQADGAFTLARSTVAGNPFDIQIRTTPWDGNAATSLTTQVAAQVGTTVVNFALDGSVTINGIADIALGATHSVQQLDGGTLTTLGAGDYQLDWANGESLTVSNGGFCLNLHTTAAASDGPGSMEGLLGTLRGPADDLALPDGTILTQPVPDATMLGTFANAWAVSGTGSMLDDGTAALLRPDALGLTGTPTFLAATAPGALWTGSLGSAAGAGMTFTGTLSDLAGAVITNFAPRDLIDITDLDSAGASLQYSPSVSGNVLTISEGGHAASMIIMGPGGGGHLADTSDQHGGTLVRLS